MTAKMKQPGFQWPLLGLVLLSAIGAGESASKVRGHLRGVCSRIQRDTADGTVKRLSSYSGRSLRLDDNGFVQIYVYLTRVDEALLDALRARECRIEIVNEEVKIVQCRAPLNRLDEISALAETRKVTAPDYAVRCTGSVNTEGDAILNADDVRLPPYNYNGTGVKVGVISDGITNRQTAITRGDLPAPPATIDIVPGLAGNGDEGTAMLEIVHDLAPGASLAFAGPTTSVEMIQAIQGLQLLGCKVICDDLIFFSQPYFEDGALALAARSAVDAGIFYCTSANNHAKVHYQGTFKSAGAKTIAGTNFNDVHDFGAGDHLAQVSLRAGEETEIILQWNNRFGSAGDNYDLYLISSNGATILDRSEDIQDGNDDPVEDLTYTPPANTTANIVINRKTGNANVVLEFFILSSNPLVTLDEYRVPAGSIIGHQAADRVFTTGAIGATKVDPTNNGNDTVEDFSGQGPSELYFPTRITRGKPEACAIDGVKVTGAGGFGDVIPGDPSARRFFGTSAASPHVAGVAALLLQAKPTLSPLGLMNLLQRTAVDVKPPVGFDYVAGSGRIDALEALKDLLTGGAGVTEPPEVTRVQAGAGDGYIDVEWEDPIGDYHAVIVAVGVNKYPTLDVEDGVVVVVAGTGTEVFRGTNGRRLTLAPVPNGGRRYITFATFRDTDISDATAATTVAVRGGDGINCVESYYGMGDCPTGATADTGGGGGGGCFVATAVYGSAYEQEVLSLRRFRDRFLLDDDLAGSFVRTYNASSPVLAQQLRKSLLARLTLRDLMVRNVVRPVRLCLGQDAKR
jgi:subtilisin family serine protease